jgi:hypothetical protein
MSTTLSKIAATGTFFVFILLSGFWLSRSGKPYSTLVFNIHKLIGLAAGIFLIVTVYRSHQVLPLRPLELTAIVFTVLVFLGLIVAGGLLGVVDAGELRNLDPSARNVITAIHRLLPYLAILSTAGTLTLLLARR